MPGKSLQKRKRRVKFFTTQEDDAWILEKELSSRYFPLATSTVLDLVSIKLTSTCLNGTSWPKISCKINSGRPYTGNSTHPFNRVKHLGTGYVSGQLLSFRVGASLPKCYYLVAEPVDLGGSDTAFQGVELRASHGSR